MFASASVTTYSMEKSSMSRHKLSTYTYTYLYTHVHIHMNIHIDIHIHKDICASYGRRIIRSYSPRCSQTNTLIPEAHTHSTPCQGSKRAHRRLRIHSARLERAHRGLRPHVKVRHVHVPFTRHVVRFSLEILQGSAGIGLVDQAASGAEDLSSRRKFGETRGVRVRACACKYAHT